MLWFFMPEALTAGAVNTVHIDVINCHSHDPWSRQFQTMSCVVFFEASRWSHTLRRGHGRPCSGHFDFLNFLPLLYVIACSLSGVHAVTATPY